jgi:carnitine 3-dehydrogenase
VSALAGAPRRAGLLGAGVIGAGWAARLVLNGVDVALYDPDPEAPRKVEAVLANARRAMAALTLAPLPDEGELTFVATPEAAAEGAELIQESAPEREPLKRELLAAASRAAPADAVLASSTSGLLPSRLQAGVEGPERVCVGHPFNPVYLLPLVEVCGGRDTAPETLERAGRMYAALGLEPLTVRREVDGFIADRLLEALWREALWLVADDLATVEEVDDAVRYGAGLRWASMGTFLTYRIAGGEAGMRHFMAQFGPALQWPWSHLTEVPELTDALLDRIVEQSDAQAAGRSLRELEQLRDDCLVAVLQGLRTHGAGAGETLARYERALLDAARDRVRSAADLSQPLRVHELQVPADWADYNGHTTEGRYLHIFGDAGDALLRLIGVDSGYLASGRSYYTVETHLSHLRETSAGDALHVTTQVLGADEKRLHAFHSLYRTADGVAAATAEQLYLHVDTEAGRATPAGAEVLERVREIAAAHAALPWPERAGRAIRRLG